MTTPATSTARDRSQGHHNPFVILAIVLSATFVQLVDISIVNVAIPSIQRELSASYGSIQLVLVFYQLGFACTLITGARLGDIYGRKRLFMIGMAGFTVASALCGAAPSPGVLVVARLIQGICSGLMFPQVLTVIQVTFPPRERGRAFGILGATIGIATIIGPLLGGSLIQLDLFGLDWRTIFYVNVPIGIAALIGAWLQLGESRAPDANRLDIRGAVLVTAGLLMLIYPLTEGRDRGWPAWLFVVLVLSVPVLVTFVAYERRKTAAQDSPLVLMTLFGDRAFRIGLVFSLVFFAGLPSFFFTFSVYLQIGLGFTALGSGLTSFPFAIGSGLSASLSDRATKRLGTDVLKVGLAILVLGMAMVLLTVHLVGVHPHSYDFTPAMFISGIGLGLVVAPVINIILAGIKTAGAGSASGVLSTVQQVGGALGVALIGVIFFGLIGANATHTADELTPQLRTELAQAGITGAAADRAVAGFRTCFDDRAHAKDPTQVPASCQGLPELPGPLAATARGKDFSRSYQQSLVYELVVFSLSLLVVFRLPRVRPGAH